MYIYIHIYIHTYIHTYIYIYIYILIFFLSYLHVQSRQLQNEKGSWYFQSYKFWSEFYIHVVTILLILLSVIIANTFFPKRKKKGKKKGLLLFLRSKGTTYPWAQIIAPHLTLRGKFDAAIFLDFLKSCNPALWNKACACPGLDTIFLFIWERGFCSCYRRREIFSGWLSCTREYPKENIPPLHVVGCSKHFFTRVKDGKHNSL